MKLITRDTDYAIRALGFIAAERPRIVAVSELVKKLKVPRPFLRKILQRLNRRGLLKSHKGLGGGFELAVSPRKILLLEVMKVFQGPLNINECFLKKSLCPNIKKCFLRKRIEAIQSYAESQLKDVSIELLLTRS